MKQIVQWGIFVTLIWFTVVQVNAISESGSLVTDIGEEKMVINQAVEFTCTTIANGDAGTMVLGTFEFSDPEAITKLEYLESKNGQWYEFFGDFGPPEGFPLTDAASRFRVTFGQAGVYTLKVSIVKADESREILCSLEQQVLVGPEKTADADPKDLTVDLSKVLRSVKTENTYVIRAEDAVILSTGKRGIRVYDDAGNLLGGGEDISSLSVSKTVNIQKVELYYHHENEFFEDWHTVPMEGFRISVDTEAPAELLLEPQIASNENGYYHTDIPFCVSAKDAGIYSGIGKVEYWIVKDEEAEGDSAILYEYEDGGEILDTYVNDGQLIVSAEEYNSRKVNVLLKVTDRAGNASFCEFDLKINVNAPKITLDISGEKSGEALEGYYHEARVLTITVKDRADTFDKNAVAVTNVDAEKIIWHSEGDFHTGQYVFEEDGHYEWDISYVNKAGLKNLEVTAPEDQHIYNFVLDQTAPKDLDIKIGGKSVLARDDSLEFYAFYREPVAVNLSADCDVSGLQWLEYQVVTKASDDQPGRIWKAYDEEAGIQIPLNEEAFVFMKVTDNAGNISIARSVGIIAEDQQPEAEIILESPNENGFYSGDVQVDFKVTEPKENGFSSGIEQISYSIYAVDTEEREEGILFAGEETVNFWSGSFVIDSEKFESNHVIVEITASDRAGNVCQSVTQDGEIRIDITKPKIDVSYDRNEAEGGRYFKTDRIATIIISEKNFRPEDAELFVSNTDGAAPQITGWSQKEENVWVSEIHYDRDGDYEFDISYTDPAGLVCDGEEVNYGDSVAPKDFTIDRTIPGIEVDYDHYETLNGNYYKRGRTATITITEHNLKPNGEDRERIKITMTAINDGTETVIPSVSSWKTTEDRHIAVIHFEEDALYTFDISVEDKAGNESEDFEAEVFYIDQTPPQIEIRGVLDHSANRGDVMPVVTYTDLNYDAGQVSVTLTGANRKNVAIDGVYREIPNGRTLTFRNFAEKKEMDDIYTLLVTLTDKAGNTAVETCTFSVNRFGSAYELDEKTENINGNYRKKPQEVVIYETNVDRLKNIVLTMFRNEETVVLKEGVDYKIHMEGGDGAWYRYIYTIPAGNFSKEGVYRLTVSSEDAAGNVAQNTLESKNLEIGFGIDRTAPNTFVANLESGMTYAVDQLDVRMNVKDNLFLAQIEVYLDDDVKPYKVWTTEEISRILSEEGEFVFHIQGDSTDSHRLKIVSKDAAGNVGTEEITDFFVTTNLWIRYYNHKPLFFGSIGGVLLFIGAIILTMKKRSKA